MLKKIFEYIFIAFFRAKFISKNELIRSSYAWHSYVDFKDALNVDCHIKKIESAYPSCYIGCIQSTFLTGTGVLQLRFSKKIFLVPCGFFSQESLLKNFSNYRLIKRSGLSGLVDYELNKVEIGECVYYVCDILYKVDSAKLSTAYNQITKQIDFSEDCIEAETGQLSKNNEFIYEYKEKMKLYFIVEKTLSDLAKLIVDKKYRIGFMHGDLTPDNIMEKNGKFILIDLDRVSFEGWPDFDRLHFKVQYFSELRQLSWFKILLSRYFLQSWSVEDLVMYYILRVDFEFRSLSRPSISYAKKVSTYGLILKSKIS